LIHFYKRDSDIWTKCHGLEDFLQTPAEWLA